MHSTVVPSPSMQVIFMPKMCLTPHLNPVSLADKLLTHRQMPALAASASTLPPHTGSVSVAPTPSQVGMASSTILSPRPLELAPAASLSELDQFCSGPLDTFLEEATRLIKRSGGNHPSKALHTSSHKKAASGPGKPPKAGGVKKAQVRKGRGSNCLDSPRLAARLQHVNSRQPSSAA